jgi:PAS domain S-box-containing protein
LLYSLVEVARIERLKLLTLFLTLLTGLGTVFSLFFWLFWLPKMLKVRKASEGDAVLDTLSKVKQMTENFPGAVYRYYQPSNLRVGQGRIYYITKGLFDLYGISSERAVEDVSYIHSLIHPDDLLKFDSSVNLQAVLGERWIHEWRIITPSGEVKWIRGNATVEEIQLDGTRVWDGVLTDITESKLLEEQRERLLELERKARTDAERASQLKDEFLTVISHELKTPLTPVLGWIKLLRKKKQDVDLQTLERGLQTIQTGVEKQMELIEDLLDASRIVCGKINLQLSQFDFSTLVTDAVELARDSLALTNTSVSIYLTISDSNFTCIGDFSRLNQVVSQLLSNAIKFTPAGGQINVYLAAEEGFAILDVVDTGTGISPDFLPDVFKVFSQEDSTDTRSVGGMGLGLAIVRHLVELHKGTITVSSPGKGKGAAFRVKLPLSISMPTDKPRTYLPHETSSSTNLYPSP